MESRGSPHVLDYYASHFRPGMIDLSASGPRVDGEHQEERLQYGPPGGLPGLRAAIAALYPDLEPESIVVTNGASEALAAIAHALLQTGDVVYASKAVYPSFREVAGRLGAVVVDDLADSSPALAVINNPTVPDGRLLDMLTLLDEVGKAGGRVVADEVHLDLRASTRGVPAVALSDTAISVGDLSKPLGLGGLRIGWIACRDMVATGAVCRAVQVLSGGPSVLAMEMATTFVRDYAARIDARGEAAARNARLVYRELGAAGWTFVPPEGGWTFLAKPPRHLTDAQLAEVERAGYFLVPAASFGNEEGGYRISVFAPPDALQDAIRIAAHPPERSGEALVVLAKAPEPGFSKTRLAARWGERAAAELSAAFLDDTLELASGCGRPTVVAFTPRDAREDFARRARGARLVTQPDGDLGARIRAALSAALSEHRAAVLIGSDTPHLPLSVLDDAFGSLASADVAIGPACDGGFYLLGLATEMVPEGLFDGIEWSTPTVCWQLMQNVLRLNLTSRLLEEHIDIDDVESLEIALRWPQKLPAAPRTHAVAGRLRAERHDGA